MEKAENEGEQKLSFRFVLTNSVIENSKKIAIKFRKFQNTIVVSFQAIICWNWQKKREIKIIVLFHSVPTRRIIENSKKIGKNLKKLKNTIVASFKAKIGWKRPRKTENKNYRSVSFLPDA